MSRLDKNDEEVKDPALEGLIRIREDLMSELDEEMVLFRKYKQRVDLIKMKIDRINVAIHAFKGYQVPEYDPDLSWKEKIIYALKSINRWATTGEILDRLSELEDFSKNKSLRSSVSLTLTRMRENKEIVFKVLKVDGKKSAAGSTLLTRKYGLKEWFDEKGNVLSIYK